MQKHNDMKYENKERVDQICKEILEKEYFLITLSDHNLFVEIQNQNRVNFLNVSINGCCEKFARYAKDYVEKVKIIVETELKVLKAELETL